MIKMIGDKFYACSIDIEKKLSDPDFFFQVVISYLDLIDVVINKMDITVQFATF